MTALVARILVVLGGFLGASAVAALVITIAMMLEWEEIMRMTDQRAGWLVIGVFTLIVSAQALLPAMLVIAVAEGFRIRSVLFYATAGGLGLVGLYYGLGLADRGPTGVLIGRDLEIMAGAGIAAGFAYWAIAGRNAGAWREQRAADTVH